MTIVQLKTDNKNFPILLSVIRKYLLKEKYSSKFVKDLLLKSGQVNIKICVQKE